MSKLLKSKIRNPNLKQGSLHKLLMMQIFVNITLGKEEVRLRLPVDILPNVNTCTKPEMRSLYAGDPAGRDWVKVLGKVKDTFLYQCMFCAEAR